MPTLVNVAASHTAQAPALTLGDDAADSFVTFLSEFSPQSAQQLPESHTSLLREALSSGDEAARYDAVLAIADALPGVHRAVVTAVRLARAAATVHAAFSLASSAVMPVAQAETQLVIAGCNLALAARLTAARIVPNAPLVSALRRRARV